MKIDEEWRSRVLTTIAEDEDPEERPIVDEIDITKDFLTSDQSFIFSDEIIIFDQKIVTATFVIVDQKVYILFKESLGSMYTPFNLDELAAIVMSPSNPMSAAFRMKD
jgi:hypothetical protein